MRGALLLVVLVLWGGGHPATAQTRGSASLEVTEEPLSRALERLATSTGISLVYDFGLVEGRRTTCSARHATPQTLLECVLDGHPVDFVQTSKGTYVLQEAVRDAPERGQVTGVVRDGDRGRPLPYAHVRLPEAGAFRGTVTDSTGRFELKELSPGAHTLVVTRVGYRRHEATVYVPPNAHVQHNATITPAPIQADSVVVDGDRYAMSGARGGEGRLSAAQLLGARVGRSPDVLTAATTLLGVTTSAPYADLHIQGSDTRGHTLQLDGVPVRNPVSMGRLLGAFTPLALDGLTAHKAGFGVLHGNARSGAIELEHDLSDRGAQYGTMRLDPRSLNARLRGGTSMNGIPVTAMVAGRMSIWDVYQDDALYDLIDRWSTLDPVLAGAQQIDDPSRSSNFSGARAKPNAGFYDLHGAARLKLGPAERILVSGYHGGTRLGANLMSGSRTREPVDVQVANSPSRDTIDAILPTRDQYSWTNTAAQVRYEGPVTGWSRGSVQASVSHYRGETRSDLGPDQPSSLAAYRPGLTPHRPPVYGQEGANEITEVNLQGRLDAAFPRFRGGVTMTSGVTYQGSRFRIGNAFAPRLRHRGRSVRVTSAVETTLGIGEHSMLEGGTRFTVVPAKERLFVEPRGAFLYDRSVGEEGKVAFRVGGGLYRQFTTQLELSRDGAMAVVPTTHIWLPVTPEMASSRTYHLASSLTWKPGAPWQVNLEGYRKWQPHLLAVNYPALRAAPPTPDGALDPSPFLGSSHGHAYGGGVHVEYEGSKATGSVRYAYSQAERTFPGRFDERMTPVPWTEPHRVLMSTEVPLGGGVSVQAKGEGVWGRSWGYRRAYYAYLTPSDLGPAWGEVGLDRPGEHVLSPLYRLDAGLSVEQSWNGVNVKGKIGIANVLNRPNVADWALQPNEDGSISRWARSLPGRRATVSVQVRY